MNEKSRIRPRQAQILLPSNDQKRHPGHQSIARLPSDQCIAGGDSTAQNSAHLKGNDRAAMAVIKMAMQMGFLEEADSDPAEAAELSAADEQILQELLSRRQEAKRR